MQLSEGRPMPQRCPVCGNSGPDGFQEGRPKGFSLLGTTGLAQGERGDSPFSNFFMTRWLRCRSCGYLLLFYRDEDWEPR